MTWKKIMTYSLTMTLTVSLLAGCGNGSQESTSNTATDSTSEAAQDDSVQIVQVTKVDGNTITADIGEMSSDHKNGDMKGDTPPSGMPSGGPDGDTPPSGAPSQSQDGDNSDGSTPPPRPSDDGNNLKDDSNVEHKDTDGESSSGKFHGGEFIASNDTITFTISDSTEITKESKDGSDEATSDDIVENSILEITLDSNNQATKIVIRNLPTDSNDKEDESVKWKDISFLMFRTWRGKL